MLSGVEACFAALSLPTLRLRSGWQTGCRSLEAESMDRNLRNINNADPASEGSAWHGELSVRHSLTSIMPIQTRLSIKGNTCHLGFRMNRVIERFSWIQIRSYVIKIGQDIQDQQDEHLHSDRFSFFQYIHRKGSLEDSAKANGYLKSGNSKDNTTGP